MVLEWTSVENAEEYKIYRDGSLLATTGSPGYTDTEVETGQTYTYRVSAVVSGTEGQKSAEASGSPYPVQPVSEKLKKTVPSL